MSDTSGTDSSEEFFDAEDSTPNRITGRKKSPKTHVSSKEFVFPEPSRPAPSRKTPPDTTAGSRVSSATNSSSSSTTVQLTQFQQPASLQEVLSTSSSTRDDDFVKSKPQGFGRQRFRELRQCMQYDEDENPGNTLTPDSQNSSVEGVFPTPRPSHPFRIIEHDTVSVQSMTSLGRVGRILAGSIDPSGISVGRDSNQLSSGGSSKVSPQSVGGGGSGGSGGGGSGMGSCQVLVDQQESGGGAPFAMASSSKSDLGDKDKVVGDSNSLCEGVSGAAAGRREEENCNSGGGISLQEPDVIASTKLAHSKTTDSLTSSGPVAPPRRKKKGRKLSSSSSEQFNLNEGLKLPPNDTQNVEVLTQEEVREGGGGGSGMDGERNLVQETPTSAKRPPHLGSMGRISQSLGSSSPSVYSKPSPSNSAKSNSAPGRVSSIDPSQGLNLYKVIRGQYVVKPQDEEANKAEGPSKEEIERIERIRGEILNSTPRERGVNLSGTGTNSLGSATRYTSRMSTGYVKERRKSAGDEEIIRQMNVYVRTRTDSGKVLTDLEILQQVPVKNLDTGEKFPLSAVEEKIPATDLNPLSLHILRLTSHLERESDDESVVGRPPGSEPPPIDEEEGDVEDRGRLRRNTARLKRFFGSTVRKTVDKAKSIASEVSHARHKEDVADVVDVVNPEQNIKIKASSTNKGPYEFAKLQHVQDLSGEHTGAVWCMKFSSCGRLLATAGQDKVLRIWVLKDAYPFFQDMRTKYNAEQKSSPTPSQESLVSHNSAEEALAMAAAAEKSPGPFMPRSFCTYTGHTSDLLDVSWSKNYFILSSSMDKTVRLWHISRRECLCCFQHIDFVTAIAFHPRDDRYFLSGSLDGKLRLWNIPDKKVALWNELDGQTKLITAANFCQNGKFAVVGSYDGRCIFYTTDQMKYHTQIHVRSTRGRNAIGRKISGIEPMPGEDKILVTSNDSRVRLYDLRDLNLSCKYKGYLNVSSQIKASFSHDGKYIVAGSENQCIYIWKTNHDYSKLSSVRRDRSDFWEGIKAHNATVTCAIFAPHPEAIIKPEPDDEISQENAQPTVPDPLVEQHKKGCGYVLVSADFNGAIKVFINKTKPKHSSLPYTAILD
ncbi:WD repeat-containing protein 44-like isoform X1 [Phlebotomus papatasi]|uniref:WD repeat-containing protein 44-like isoform X1 n=1 Tax=Phlebotomus papatasi TaxID=29031 RepID=UPI002483D54F|nr:WD repeat-containing protein 44-like isoform X1 [Phlebotomus papatasi]